MASLLTDAQRVSFGSNFNDLFDTLSRDIVIYKEPIKNITSVNQTPIFGYPGDQLPESVTYTPVYATYKARIFYGNPEEDLIGLGSEIKNPKAVARIRVKSETKDYIENGRTEKITFDGKSWNVQYGFVVKRYVDESYYEYMMKETT
jgi:hypothetical protein